MAKNPKRVAAGKRVWAAMSAAKKAKVLSRFKRSPARAAAPGGASRGGGSTTKKKQGIVSWLTSLFALFIGLWPIWYNIREMLVGGRSIVSAAGELNQYYNPLEGNTILLKRAYGSLIGGIVFKIATSELAKRARVMSVIPALHA